MGNKLDVLEALDHIDPAGLDYQEWLGVGMGLKEAGCPVTAWEEWSRRDGGRYHPGECEKKWNGFRGSADPVTAGTIVRMARDRGWRPAPSQPGHELSWDDEISAKDEQVIVNPDWL